MEKKQDSKDAPSVKMRPREHEGSRSPKGPENVNVGGRHAGPREISSHASFPISLILIINGLMLVAVLVAWPNISPQSFALSSIAGSPLAGGPATPTESGDLLSSERVSFVRKGEGTSLESSLEKLGKGDEVLTGSHSEWGGFASLFTWVQDKGMSSQGKVGEEQDKNTTKDRQEASSNNTSTSTTNVVLSKEARLLKRALAAFGSGQRFYRAIHISDNIAGETHFQRSLLCLAREAKLLNRTFILEPTIMLTARHNYGKNVARPFRLYYNVTDLGLKVTVMTYYDFWRLSRVWEKHTGRKLKRRTYPGLIRTAVLENSTEDVVTRRLIGNNTFGFKVCDLNPEKHLRSPEEDNKILRKFGMIQHVDVLNGIAEAIVKSLHGNYSAVHVRRGDKAKDKKKWPNLDRDTRPLALMQRLPQLIPLGEDVYISSDESPKFFNPLRKLYRLHFLSDYQQLWGKSSAWHKWARKAMGKRPVFDTRMQVIVDYQVFAHGNRRVYTFNDLTKDAKNGRRLRH